ncbi:MAG TPA: TetR/AcrR family transcriptional regulator [Thermoanaerobaculia bacterium]|nr:TetR/AcrR family transcriptional regulator [Thermoanaerobaculia bacterium]
MGPRERRQREKDDTRQSILDAARELFVSEGYDGVSMRRIAEKIEYSPTAIYFHFKDKDTLIHALCDADFLTLAEQFAGAARIPDPIDRIIATGRAYAEFGLTHPNHYRLMFMTPHEMRVSKTELDHGNPEEDAYAFLKSTVAEGIAKGLFREEYGNDVELISQTFWAGVHGVISLEIAKHNDDWVEWATVQRRLETMINALVTGLVKKG